MFNNQILFEVLGNIKSDNVKHEYYLTDAIAGIIATGGIVDAVAVVQPEEAISVNSRDQLSEAGRIMRQRVQQDLMKNGVTIVDPDNTWIDGRARIGQDTIIEPFTYIHGKVEIGQNCRIGPFAYLQDGTILKNGITYRNFSFTGS
ncbi:hypothetical protein ACFLZ8_06405 [Planctomycetota bacterium]